MTSKIKWLPLAVSLMISLGVGIFSGFLTRNTAEAFALLHKPALTPPAVLFPVVWSILYILMGISAYLIYTSGSVSRHNALNLYIVQLFLNFLWSILFFGLEWRLFAFVWLVVLWILIIEMILAFKKINPAAAYLQIPYLVWVTFAGYLNLAVYLLNK